MTAARDTIAEALNHCDSEPIRIPGSIQPHGFLLALDSRGKIAQASANAAAALGLPLHLIYGRDLLQVLGAENGDILEAAQAIRLDSVPGFFRSIQAADGFTYQAIAHRQSGVTILEFERAYQVAGFSSSVFGLVQWFMSQIAPASSLAHLNGAATREIRKLTGFDRVMIYRFDSDWNGTVIAEDGNNELPSYLDLRFPAADIPAQARELYRLNRLRLIPDSGFAASPIQPALHPDTGLPLDLTYSVLRSVSPVHVQYMRNMGTAASMSISILRDGILWGLISCHKHVPGHISFEVRNACDVIAQVLSAQIAALDHQADANRRLAMKTTQTRLLTYMTEEDGVMEGLSRHPGDLFACTGSAGAAILYEGQCRIFGVAPTDHQVRDIASWLSGRGSDNLGNEETVFSTEFLSSLYPPAQQFADIASGLTAAPISSLHESYIMWFRPELVHTVKWGGDPDRHKEANVAGRLSPPNSFEVWKEQVRGRSEPWNSSEIDSAADLRHIIIRIVLRKAEELAQLTDELRKSNQELEAFSYSVSHDLRAPFRHIVGFAELLGEREAANISETGRRYISTIIESAHFAGTLVDNLLSFSQLGRASLHYTEIDSRKLVEEVKAAVLRDEPDRNIQWRIGPLPAIRADLFMIRQVFQNLISNACKYSRPREVALIEISASRGDNETVFTVRDNGVGFDAQYSDKLFGIFQRLHSSDAFEGTGIGLANVKRIVTRHGGLAWAEGATDQGAVFSFSIPDLAEADCADE